jgi:hypothetical protein
MAMKRWNFKYVMIAAACMVVMACSRGGSPLCVYGDDFGDVITKRVEMKAAGAPGASEPVWIDTGVEVTYLRSLQIATLGNIELCNSATAKERVIVNVNANNNAWTPANIAIGSNMPWEITSVTGTITDGPLPVTASSSGAGGAVAEAMTSVTPGRQFKGGERLYMYVGNFSNVADKDNWFGTLTPVGETYNSEYLFTEVASTAAIPAPSPLITQNGFRYAGKLYFRIYDHTGAMDPDKKWGNPEDYTDNTGSYTVTVQYTKSCQGTKGQFMQASIGTKGGIAGSVRDLSMYALGVGGSPAGTFNDKAWATGRLWLSIIDDANKRDWGGLEGTSVGDNDYTPRELAPADSTKGNYGSYFVNIVTTKPFDDSISNMINKVIDPVKDIMYGDPDSSDPSEYGLTKRMYLGLTSHSGFIQAVRAAMTLSIVFFALGYMIGLSNVNTASFIMYMLKVLFVVILIGPDSWTFFYEHLFTLFIHGVEELVWIMSGQFADSIAVHDRFSDLKDLFVKDTDPIYSTIKDGVPAIYNGVAGVLHGEAAKNIESFFIMSTDPEYSRLEGGTPIVLRGIEGKLFDPDVLQTSYNTEASHHAFAFLNQTLSRFFTRETNIKISALLSGFPLGWVFALLIYVGIFFFIVGVVRAITAYMLSIIMTGLLLFMAPIFISFLLFPTLKNLVDRYIKQLIGFAIQPVLMFMVLSLFNVFIYSIFYALLSYSVCWGCIWHIDLPINGWLGVDDNFDRFCIFEGYRPWGLTGNQELAVKLNKFPVSLFSILIFLILGSAMEKFLLWVADFAKGVVGGNAISSLDGSAGAGRSPTAELMGSVKNTAGTVAGQALNQLKPIKGEIESRKADVSKIMADFKNRGNKKKR